MIANQVGYEIRLYPKHLVAETVVEGSYKNALNKGFRILASYIFGNNTTQSRMAMTAPVLMQPVSESIAMTAPVLTSIDGAAHTVTFGIPRQYTTDTVPTPNDTRVTIVSIPARKMAALGFSWLRTKDRVQSKKQSLLVLLKRDGLSIKGDPVYAGYNAPWTPPWMVRHEVMVEIH